MRPALANAFRPPPTSGPNVLIQVNGKTLLERTLTALGAAGVREAVIVIGYRGALIVKAIGARCCPVAVRYIRNEQYKKGAILSLWSARHEFDADLLVMDADVLFPVRLLKRLVHSRHASCFLLDPSSENTGEEQMLLTRAGRVLTIIRGGAGDYDLVGESVGFFKVAREAVPLLRSILEDCVAQGRDTIEHEEAFSVLLAQHPAGFERVDDLPWTEIDFPQDLEYAERAILPAIERLDALEEG